MLRNPANLVDFAPMGEVNNAPSVVVPTECLSLKQLFDDYSRGVVHQDIFRDGRYDYDGDPEDFETVHDLDDFSQIPGASPYYVVEDVPEPDEPAPAEQAEAPKASGEQSAESGE